MPLGSASDLAFILQDAGELLVVYNGVQTSGIFDLADALEPTGDGGMVQTRATTILVATDAFEDLAINGRITTTHKITKVRSTYRIDRIAPEDDGELTRLYVAKIA